MAHSIVGLRTRLTNETGNMKLKLGDLKDTNGVVPVPRNPHFVQRHNIMTRLDALLARDACQDRVCIALTGLSGVG